MKCIVAYLIAIAGCTAISIPRDQLLIQLRKSSQIAFALERNRLGGTASCCSKCAGRSFCSPGSGNCYDWQKKDYYKSCPVTTVPTPHPVPSTPIPTAISTP